MIVIPDVWGHGLAEIEATMNPSESYYRAILEVAQKDPDVIGFILERSRGKGFVTPCADYDITIIVCERYFV